MQVVDSADVFPMDCAASGRTQGPFLQTDRVDQYGQLIYLNVDFLINAVAPMVGLVSAEDSSALVSKMEAELAGVREQLDTVTKERDEAVARLAAVDVLESAGFRARKKTGRPRKEETDGA